MVAADDLLHADGFPVWRDIKRLQPGDDWKESIEAETEEVDFAIPGLSARSVKKNGLFQTELKRILTR